MATVVMNSAGEIERLQTGKAPERPEIEADNAKQRAEAAASENKSEKAPESVSKAAPEQKPAKNEAEEPEGEDGLTDSERKEYTAKMLRTVARKTRQVKDAEEFAADQYNQRRLADQRAERLEQELAELKKQPPKAPEPVKELIRPKREAFETQEAYEDALLAYGREVDRAEAAKERAKEAERQEAERQQKITEDANERLRKAAELIDDFEETVDRDMRIPGHIAGYMRESELFAELGYHFAKNPDIVDRLAKHSPAKALVEVGKIESTLQPFSSRIAAGSGEKVNGATPSSSKTESANSQAAANGKGAGPSPTESTSPGAGPRQSRAPVIKPLGSDSVSQVEKEPGQMSTREVIEAWKVKNRANLGLRKRH